MTSISRSQIKGLKRNVCLKYKVAIEDSVKESI